VHNLKRWALHLASDKVNVALGLLKANCTQKSVMFVVVVFVGGSANGGSDEKMFDCYCLTRYCNRTRELLKGSVTSLYCARLKYLLPC
jgi:hypothetical protein